jgi:hypothetical protein
MLRPPLVPGLYEGVYDVDVADNTPFCDAGVAAVSSVAESVQPQFREIGLEERFCGHRFGPGL